MIGPASIFRRRSDVRYRVVPPEAVVIRQDAPEVLVLNEVAGRLVDLVDGQTPVSGLVAALAGEYDVAGDVLERDVLGFMQELLDAGVVEEADGGR